MAPIVTPRLTLLPTVAADARGIAAMAEDFEVVRHTGTWPWPADPAVTAQRCAEPATEDGERLTVRVQDIVIGMVLAKSGGEFRYMLARAHWDKGYATEMGHAAIAHFFATRPWPRLTAKVFEDNPASIRVLEKLGFVEGPPSEEPCLARGGRFLLRSFALERSYWPRP